jgi:hypothetical protein
LAANEKAVFVSSYDWWRRRRRQQSSGSITGGDNMMMSNHSITLSRGGCPRSHQKRFEPMCCSKRLSDAVCDTVCG